MAHTICYEVFPNGKNINHMREVLVERHGFVEKKNQRGSYFYIETSSMDAWQMNTVLKARNYKYRTYDKRYERSTNYRKEFFDTHKGPYRCAYCGKRLKDDYIEVDHLIPVSKAKTSTGVRTWLQLCGVKNVNDPKNLVASCKKCNRKKSDNMGHWVIRGAIGRSNTIWVIRDTIMAALVIGVLVIIFL